MEYGIYTYRDNKTHFGQIWYDLNDEAAKRGFAMMVSNPEGVMGFAPQDFDLFKIGTFDSGNGQLVPIWPIEYMMNGCAAVERKTDAE